MKAASIQKKSQMKNIIKLNIMILMTITFCSCLNKAKSDDRIETWYSKLKNEIVENSKQKQDSILYEQKDETLFLTYFLKGYRIKQEYRSLDTVQLFVTKAYGQNNNFELRSEIHKNGQKATEGITYRDNYYGPWTVWYEHGQMMYKGNRYESINFGSWTYYTEKGKVQKVVDNKRLDLTDSILEKENLHTTLGLAFLGQPK